jgi:hypothetical protein
MYCVKCKRKTETKDKVETVSKNGKQILKGTRSICGSKKSSFAKPSTGSGIVANTVGHIPLVGNFLKPLLEKIGLGINNIKKFEKNGSCCCKKSGVKVEKIGNGLFLSHEGGLLPLIPLIGAILGGLGGLGGLAGGIAGAVNASKSVAEQNRHNRAIEEQMKGSGLFLSPQGSGLFLGPPR